MNLPPIALLAGGTATRLRPITETVPKSLVAVMGEPFLAHQMRLFHRMGFRKLVILTGHFGDQIVDFAGDGTAFGLDVRYVRDGEFARGTGGAVRNAIPVLGSTFFVCYGDLYLDIDVVPIFDAFVASGYPALMTVLHNHGQWDRSNVDFDGKLVRAHSKDPVAGPGFEWIDFGLSIFDADVFSKFLKPDPVDLLELTRELARNQRLVGFEVSKRFYEIGTPAGLAETEMWTFDAD